MPALWELLVSRSTLPIRTYLQVPSSEWFQALPSQLHNHPGYSGFAEAETAKSLHNYSVHTIGVRGSVGEEGGGGGDGEAYLPRHR